LFQLLQFWGWGANCGKMKAMAKKRKVKKFRKVEAVKALARERVGTPPASRPIPDHRDRAEEKHKTTLKELLTEND